MIVYMEMECIIYGSQSLKHKRSIIQSFMKRVRNSFNVSISEIDFLNQWQRSKIGVVMVANQYRFQEQVMQKIQKLMDQESEMERTITVVDRL